MSVKRTYSERDRELAAVRASLFADHWARRDIGPSAYDFQPTPGALALCEAAFVYVARRAPDGFGGEYIAALCGEAEALIRTGWIP